MLKNLDKSLVNVFKELRELENDINTQDSENRKIEGELFSELSTLKEKVRTKSIEKAFLSRITSEVNALLFAP